jgi:urease accessory protein
VKAKMEDLLVTTLNDPGRVAILAYELGNRHLPISIRHGFLATPYDRLVEELLAKMGIPYEREKGKFEPMSAHHQH